MRCNKLLVLLLPLLALAVFGCAKDTNEEGGEEKYPLEVKLAFRTRNSFDPNTWYFMVFNFTAAPSTAADSAPLDQVSAEDRGKNWELYVALNPNSVGEDTLVTLQRPALPTLLPVAEGPVDMAVDDINQDGLMDVLIACREGNVIQAMAGKTIPDTHDAVFFTDPGPIDTGPQPFRLFANQFSGEIPVDLLVIYAGEDGASPFLRVLDGDGLGSFTLVSDTELTPGIPIDALIADLNGDSILDLVLVTTKVEGGDGELRIILRDSDGVFSESSIFPLGPDPGQLAIGQLDDAGADLAVAIGGTSATDGEVQIFHGAGDGTFTPRATPLSVPGTCTSVAMGMMLRIGTDTIDDVLVGYTDSSGVGNLGVFVNNVIPEGESPPPEEAFGALFVSTPTQIQPGYVVAFDTGDDNHLDALVVDGSPGSESNTFLIQRGLLEGEGLVRDQFVWDPEPITYASGVEPSKITLADIDGNGVTDVLTSNSANTDGGNSVSLYYGLGKDNFTSADVFWVDREPELLILQDWHLSHNVGPNFFELVIDPGLFYDLARRQPDEFIVDFMTSTTGIDIASNFEWTGEIMENLSSPVNVPMDIGFFNDEQNSPRVDIGAVSLGSQDLVDWRIEVL